MVYGAYVMNQRGGTRKGSGRKLGSGKYGTAKTVAIRIPENLADEVENYCKSRLHGGSSYEQLVTDVISIAREVKQMKEEANG